MRLQIKISYVPPEEPRVCYMGSVCEYTTDNWRRDGWDGTNSSMCGN